MTDPRPLRLDRGRSAGPPPPGAERRPRCLIATQHPERSLSRALAQHLAEELPAIDFTLVDHPGIEFLWVCGYERGGTSLIRRWRARHPRAVLVVTSKDPVELWEGEALAAGADHALPWPVDLRRLARILHRRPLQHLA